MIRTVIVNWHFGAYRWRESGERREGVRSSSGPGGCIESIAMLRLHSGGITMALHVRGVHARVGCWHGSVCDILWLHSRQNAIQRRLHAYHLALHDLSSPRGVREQGQKEAWAFTYEVLTLKSGEPPGSHV